MTACSNGVSKPESDSEKEGGCKIELTRRKYRTFVNYTVCKLAVKNLLNVKFAWIELMHFALIMTQTQTQTQLYIL
jgi:hypothetical protein